MLGENTQGLENIAIPSLLQTRVWLGRIPFCLYSVLSFICCGTPGFAPLTTTHPTTVYRLMLAST